MLILAGLNLMKMELTKVVDLLFLGGGKNVDTRRNKQAIFFETSKNFQDALDLILSGRYERLNNNSSSIQEFLFSIQLQINFSYVAHTNFIYCAFNGANVLI